MDKFYIVVLICICLFAFMIYLNTKIIETNKKCNEAYNLLIDNIENSVYLDLDTICKSYMLLPIS